MMEFILFDMPCIKITLFDTAPQYGTHEQDGVAEIVLGKSAQR